MGVLATTLTVMMVVALAPDDASAAPVQSNGIYMIMAGHTGLMALDVAGGDTAADTPVQIWTIHGGPNQRWRIVKTGTSISGASLYSIRPMHAPGKCLDIEGGLLDSGALALINLCNIASKFTIEDESPANDVKRIVVAESGLPLDVWNADIEAGTPVQQYAPNPGANQRWAFIRIG